jgi:hypothetical protein
MNVVQQAFLSQMALHRMRLNKVREAVRTEADKLKLVEWFIEWLNITQLKKRTKSLYIADLNFILIADDEAVLWACSTTQNTRTVLKHLVEIIESKKKARRK